MTSWSLRICLLFAEFYVYRTLYQPWEKFDNEYIHSSSSYKGRIPKTLHFVHLSPGIRPDQEPIPDSIRQTIAEWNMLHPGWEIHIWDNAAVREEFPDILSVLAQIETIAWAADLLWYHLLEHFGGIYLDTDIVTLRPLEQFLIHAAFTICEEPFQDYKQYSPNNVSMPQEQCEIACNAVIGAKPHHPALQNAIEITMNNMLKALEKNLDPEFDVLISGPR